MIGTVPFSMIALIIGQALDGQASNTGTLLLLILLSFIGGILVPDSALPATARDIGKLFPSSHLASATRHALAGSPIPISAVLVLAGWSFAAAVLALVLRRRDDAG